MQFRQNMTTFATLLGSLRTGVVAALVSVCGIEFRPQERNGRSGGVLGGCVRTGRPDNPKERNA